MRDASVAFNEDEGATIQGAQGSSVSVAANHFDAATGTAAMQVAITSLDLTQSGVEYALPGLHSGPTDQGDAYTLAFMGVVEVEFSDAQGSEVDLLADKTAQVVIPVVINGLDESSVEWRVGDSVPVWTLNEATGEWRQSGLAEVVANEQSPTGLAVVTQVSSFSFHAVGVQLFDNTQPTAVISGDLNVTVGDEITLDAAASTDAEDDLLSYQWSFVARPQGSDAVIADSTAESITFTADRAGSYTVQLVVNDGALDSAPATETVTVEPGLPLAIESLTPVDGSSVADENIEIIIQLNQSAITHLGEIPYVTDANNQITLPLALLEGVNSLTLTFDNQLGQTVEETITYYLDTIAPPKPDATAITVSVVGNEMLVSGGAGSVEPGSLVTLTNQETEVVITVVAEADGSFSALVTAAPQDTIGITSTDAATNVSDVLVVRGSTVDPDHSSSLTGQVMNTAEQLVSGAVIKAVNLSSTMVDAQTINQNGGYQLQLNAASGYLLKITAAGYADQYRVVETAPVEQSQVTDIVMVPRAAPETLDEDEGGQVQTAEGAAVTLPGNSVEAALGTGAIALTVTGLDVTDGIVYAAIPGTLAGTTDQGGYDLEINGLIEITLRDATGETLELLDTVEAQVVIPVYANDDFFVANPLTHGDTVALWTLDAATGTWIADGEAEVVLNERSPTGLAVVTTVSSLTYHAIGTRVYHNSAPVAVISGENKNPDTHRSN